MLILGVEIVLEETAAGRWRWEAKSDAAFPGGRRYAGMAETCAAGWGFALEAVRAAMPALEPRKTWEQLLDVRVPSGESVNEIVEQIKETTFARGVLIGRSQDSDERGERAATRVWCDRAPYVVQGGLTEINRFIYEARQDDEVFAVVLYKANDGEPVHLYLDKISATEGA